MGTTEIRIIPRVTYPVPGEWPTRESVPKGSFGMKRESTVIGQRSFEHKGEPTSFLFQGSEALSKRDSSLEEANERRKSRTRKEIERMEEHKKY